MNPPERVLIVDATALCYQAHFGMPRLSSKVGTDTHVIYGFFTQIQHACRSLRVGHMVFAWDSRKSLRKHIFPQYKSGRSHKPVDPALQEAYTQFNELRVQILPALGFVNTFLRPGFEADDIIASVCRSPGPQDGQQYFIFSGDQDLYQLLTHSISMYSTKKGIYTKQDFIDEYKIDPQLWSAVKCLAGCVSDSVPGIEGIGPKRAIEYLHDYRDYGRPHKKIDTPEGRAIVERNKPLVTLPFAGTPDFALDWKTYPDYAAWMALCEEKEFESFLQKPSTWENIFSLTPPDGDGTDRIRMGGKKVKD